MSESPTDLDTSGRENTPRDDARNGQVTADASAKQTDNDLASNRAEIAKQAARKRRRPYVMVIGLAIVGLLLAGGIYYWLSTRNLESTDDAYTDGRAITIAPQVSGVVVSLDVTDNQFVKKGQPLIHIDPRQYSDRSRSGRRGAGDGEGAICRTAIRRRRSPARIFPPSWSRPRRSSPTPRPISPEPRPTTTASAACRSRRRPSRTSMPRRPRSSRPKRRSCWPKRKSRRIRRCRSASARPTRRSGS